ncbi:hypothetical protein FVW20_05455 [Desulfovibrio oxamicus]|uniref:Uncharacterized protein n=1 Tax=Nitratidesulfovibrio oxamicus TaxID=32016 RepID=A0ABS0J227_9BACT|nr:hypothetical protein [Nitratidesulfovibrio oxamicus]
MSNQHTGTAVAPLRLLIVQYRKTGNVAKRLMTDNRPYCASMWLRTPWKNLYFERIHIHKYTNNIKEKSTIHHNFIDVLANTIYTILLRYEEQPFEPLHLATALMTTILYFMISMTV